MKIASTRNPTFDEALRQLSAGIRSLDSTADRARARRTARQRVLRALRRVRAILDAQAPAIIERAPGERLRTFKAREARLLKRGYVRADAYTCGGFATAGVPIKKITHRTRQPNNRMFEESGTYVPAWAIAIGVSNPTKLRQAKKSVVMQKAVLAEKALRESVLP